MNKSYIASILAFSLISPLVYAKAADSTRAADVQACYSKFPYLMSTLHELSDHDFLDQEKSIKRISFIQNSLKKDSSQILNCIEQIVNLEKDEKNLDDVNFVNFRLSEVRILLLQKQVNNRAELDNK